MFVNYLGADQRNQQVKQGTCYHAARVIKRSLFSFLQNGIKLSQSKDIDKKEKQKKAGGT